MGLSLAFFFFFLKTIHFLKNDFKVRKFYYKLCILEDHNTCCDYKYVGGKIMANKNGDKIKYFKQLQTITNFKVDNLSAFDSFRKDIMLTNSFMTLHRFDFVRLTN